MLHIYDNGSEFLYEERELIERVSLHLREFIKLDAPILKDSWGGWAVAYSSGRHVAIGLKVRQWPVIISCDDECLEDFVYILKKYNLRFDNAIMLHALASDFKREYRMRFSQYLQIGRPELGMYASVCNFGEEYLRAHRVELGDMPKVIRCIESCKEGYTGSADIPDDIPGFVEQHMENQFVVREGDEIASVASIHRNTLQTATISGVYTNPRYRNRGYAHCVVSRAAREICNKNLLPLLFCYEDNLPARRVYESLGFQIDEVYTTCSLVD